MELTVSLHREELNQVLRDFLPMRLMLRKLDSDDPAWVRVDALDTVTFLPGRGLALTCRAQVHYPLPILPDDFTVSHLSLEMVPEIVPARDGPVLAFRLDLADLAIEYLPAFVDRVVAGNINAALREHVTTIAWDFTKALTRIVHFPERLGLVRALELGAPRGQVEVTADSMVLRLALDLSFHHETEEASEPCPTQP